MFVGDSGRLPESPQHIYIDRLPRSAGSIGNMSGLMCGLFVLIAYVSDTRRRTNLSLEFDFTGKRQLIADQLIFLNTSNCLFSCVELERVVSQLLTYLLTYTRSDR